MIHHHHHKFKLGKSLKVLIVLSLRSKTHNPFLSSVLNLVRHVVSDVTVRNMVKSASIACQRRQTQERDGNVIDDNDTKISWCLPTAMSTLQPSIFNYIRLGLACGSIHDKRSIFHRALETWLIWIEPWNYVMKRRAVAASGRKGSSSSSSGCSSK